MHRTEIGDISLETLTAGDGRPLLFLHGGDYFAQHRDFFESLARRWRVMAPRHPGFGGSERPDGFRTVHDLAYLYLDLLDRRDLREHLRRTFFNPARIAPDYSAFSDEEAASIARDRAATALYGWRPYMHNPGLLQWLHRVRVPTLVVWGEKDGIVGPGYGEKLCLSLPDARFELIRQAGHYPQIERPDEVADAVERFVRAEVL